MVFQQFQCDNSNKNLSGIQFATVLGPDSQTMNHGTILSTF